MLLLSANNERDFLFNKLLRLFLFIVNHIYQFWRKINELLTQNFGLTQIESICRRQNKCDSTTEICFGRDRKLCGKRRKCWLPTLSPFPTMLSKGYFLGVVKSRDCMAKISTMYPACQ